MSPVDAAIIGSLVTTVLGAVVAGVVKLISVVNANREGTEKRTLDEAFKVIEVKGHEIIELRKDGHDLRDKLQELTAKEHVCQVKLARMEEKMDAQNLRIEMLVKLLEDSDVSSPLMAPPESKTHKKLTDGGL